MLIQGAPSPERPFQRRPHHILPLIYPLPYTARQHRSLQHYNFSQPNRLPQHLHGFYWLSPH